MEALVAGTPSADTVEAVRSTGRAPVSDRGTFGGLTQFATQFGFWVEPLARKPLILIYGEMSEWLKEHAWKALRSNSVETY